MCPDQNLLSAFFDGELDERFAAEVEAHVVECERCREVLKGFSDLSANLSGETLPGVENVKHAAWSHLRERFSSLDPVPVWRRRFQIPAPVFAGLALIIIALGVGLLFSINADRGSTAFDTVTEARITNSTFVTFEDIIEYLDARGGQTFVFTLPQDTRVQYWSEPTLVKAADFRRGRD
jgi:anti-sigma factor RsiW